MVGLAPEIKTVGGGPPWPPQIETTSWGGRGGPPPQGTTKILRTGEALGTGCRKPEALNSLVPQRDHRIDPQGAASRRVRGEQYDDQEHA